MTIRKAQLKDLTEIVKLEKKLYKHYRRFLPNNLFLIQNKEIATTFYSNKILSKIDMLWVCVHYRKVVGFLLLEKDMESIYVIAVMYIVPKLRNNGLGTKLIKQCVKFATENQIKTIKVATPKGNSKGIIFCKKMEFVLDKSKKDQNLDYFRRNIVSSSL